MPDTQTQLDLLDAVHVPSGRAAEIAEILSEMSNMNRAPDVLREVRAIMDLVERGATIPQIANAFDIPEALIVARLRIGGLLPGLRILLEQGRMSVTLAQRLGAESLQTQSRIFNDFQARENDPGRGANHRFTTRDAYPERPQDEQIRLISDHTQQWRTLQPDALDNFFTDIPTQTRRDVFRRVYESTHTQEWVDLAETAIPIGTRARLASYYIVHNNANAFLSLLTADARERIRQFYEATFLVQRATVEAERDDARRRADEMAGEVTRLLAEISRQRERYRTLETMIAARGGVPAPAPNAPTQAEGRAYREMLSGGSDDPGETQTGTNVNAEAQSAAQFDYPVVEESWELVVDHLTDAADAMPLSPSDESDRFHTDIEALRLRAIVQQRAENANAGIVSGTIIPPETPAPPAPAPSNRGHVRIPRERTRVEPIGQETTLTEHARLLREQADAINANTRPGRSSNTAPNPRAETAVQRTMREAREAIESSDRPSGRARAQQEILESSRQNQQLVETVMSERGLTRAQSAELIRRTVVEGRGRITVGMDGRPHLEISVSENARDNSFGTFAERLARASDTALTATARDMERTMYEALTTNEPATGPGTPPVPRAESEMRPLTRVHGQTRQTVRPPRPPRGV